MVDVAEQHPLRVRDQVAVNGSMAAVAVGKFDHFKALVFQLSEDRAAVVDTSSDALTNVGDVFSVGRVIVKLQRHGTGCISLGLVSAPTAKRCF